MEPEVVAARILEAATAQGDPVVYVATNGPDSDRQLVAQVLEAGNTTVYSSATELVREII